MRHLIDITDLSVEEINSLIKTAEKIINDKKHYSQVCRGKKLATLFFEPSTRTRLSFEAAMIELGGNVLGFSSADCSSTAKGETVTDTIRTVGCYADIIAMRHPKEGAPKAASAYSPVPVINAGDGGHNHPTQTLADLFTICREKRRLNNFTIGFCGDLMFGRTVHSLIAALSRYDNINYVLISPEELRIPSYIKDGILKGSNCRESECIEDVISELDILYMTRVQKERFFNEADYIRLKDSYILEPKKLKNAKDDMIIMHPLPRVNEIPHSIDRDKRACYFKQVLNGKYIRMALILKLLETEVLYED